MHISDGVLSGPVLAGGFAATAVIAGITLRKMDMEEIPKVAVITAVFFVAALVRFSLGGISLHLTLNGLVGMVLGVRAFPAILVGIILQAILFGHGGVSVIGINTAMLGGGALIAFGVWQLRHFVPVPKREVVFGVLAGAAGIMSSGIIMSLAMTTTGKEFAVLAKAVIGAHLVLMVIEGAVVGAAAGFLAKVKPDALAGRRVPKVVAAPAAPAPSDAPKAPMAVLVLVAGLLAGMLSAPGTAQAHKLLIDYTPQENGLLVEVFFPDGTPAREVNVRVMTETGDLIHQATTDQTGGYLFAIPDKINLVADGDDGLGHAAEVEISAAELAPINLAAQTEGGARAGASKVHREAIPVGRLIAGFVVIAALAGGALLMKKRGASSGA